MNNPKRSALATMTREQRNLIFMLRLVRYLGATADQQRAVKKEIRRCQRESRLGR